MNLNTLSESAHENAVDKGFWDDRHEVPESHLFTRRIALIHSEISEAAEYAFKDILWLPEHRREFVEELADVCIRLLDLNGYMGFDLNAYYYALDPEVWAVARGTSEHNTLLEMHHCVSNLLEAHRKNLGERIMASSIAFTIWLAARLSEDLDHNLARMIEWKMAKNRGRQYKHGAAY